jgi:hypothetical protein
VGSRCSGRNHSIDAERLTSFAGVGLAAGEKRGLTSGPEISLELDPSSFEVGLGLNFVAALTAMLVELIALIPAGDEFSITREYKIGVDLLRARDVLAG